MSAIMGSIDSVVEDEDDIVIDSGGRQVGHLNNWQNSYNGRNPPLLQHQNKIHSGIKNKNLLYNNRDNRT